MQLQVKSSVMVGCVFLGKGIVDHPEMGVIEECREVTFDMWDVMFQEWTGKHEMTKVMYRTDTGYAFDQDTLDGMYQIENYAPNWRAKKKDAWGII